MKKKILVIALLVAIIAVGSLVFLNSSNKTAYYTIINNSEVVSKGTDKYEYQLDSYDEQGNKKNISFGTSRLLKENAFLKLEVVPLRGVVSWEEVQYKELPEQVKNVYPK
jgi:uncharacterized protein (TIGR01655 family)